MVPQEYITYNHEYPPKGHIPIINLLLYITLLPMVLTLPVTQYPIKIASILRFWATNFLIPTMDTEFMGGFRCTSEGDDYCYYQNGPSRVYHI